MKVLCNTLVQIMQCLWITIPHNPTHRYAPQMSTCGIPQWFALPCQVYTEHFNKTGSFCQKHYLRNSIENAGWLCVAHRDADGAVLPGLFLNTDHHVEERLYWCRRRLRTKRNSYFMMTSSNVKISRVTDPLFGQFNGHRWISRTKASDAELWRFLWSVPE